MPSPHTDRGTEVARHQSLHFTTEETAWGGVLGAFLGAVLALPVAALAACRRVPRSASGLQPPVRPAAP
jgi:hypothetical protein